MNVTGAGSTRCRLFTSKVSTTSLMAMETAINEWLDRENVEIKHVTQTIGIMQDKVKEENMIVYVWY